MCIDLIRYNFVTDSYGPDLDVFRVRGLDVFRVRGLESDVSDLSKETVENVPTLDQNIPRIRISKIYVRRFVSQFFVKKVNLEICVWFHFIKRNQIITKTRLPGVVHFRLIKKYGQHRSSQLERPHTFFSFTFFLAGKIIRPGPHILFTLTVISNFLID